MNTYEITRKLPVGAKITIDGVEGTIQQDSGFGHGSCCQRCDLDVNTCNFCCSRNKRADKNDVVFIANSSLERIRLAYEESELTN